MNLSRIFVDSSRQVLLLDLPSGLQLGPGRGLGEEEAKDWDPDAEHGRAQARTLVCREYPQSTFNLNLELIVDRGHFVD